MRNLILRVVLASAATVVIILTAPVRSHAAPPAVADCDQTYYPLRLGQKYVYATAGRKRVAVFTKVDHTSFTYETTEQAAGGPPGKKTISTGTCVADGIQLDSVGMGATGTFKFRNRTGVDFGRPAAMKVGGTWVSGVTMEMTIGGQARTITLASRYKVIAVERVRVPAGEYEALRIEASTEMKGGMLPAASEKGANQIPTQAPSQSTTTLWLAKGVGPIKMEMRASAAIPAITTELLNYTR